MSTPEHIRGVTISRQIGAHGEAIAREVAARLQFRYLDREVLERAATQSGVTPKLVGSAEHFPSLRERMLHALNNSSASMMVSWFAPAPMLAESLYTSERYRSLLEEVIREVAHEGSAVILGHGCQVILRDRWDTLRVLVSGSDHLRALRLCERTASRDLEAARRDLMHSDDAREAYFSRVYGVDWLSPKLYDLSITTDHWSTDEAAGLICSAAYAR